MGVTYPCLLCGYLGTQKQSLKEHERARHGLRKLECKFCHETFAEHSRKNLRHHMKTVHGTEVKILKRGKSKFMSKPTQINREILLDLEQIRN